MYYKQDDPYGACGVNHVYDFSDVEWSYYADITEVFPGQAGFVMAAFVQGDSKCDKAYKQLTRKFQIVYESSWRINKNSGNMFKLVIFDGIKKRVKKAAVQQTENV